MQEGSSSKPSEEKLRNLSSEAMMEGAPIQCIKVWSYTIPTPEEESDGTLSWDSTTMIVVELDAAGQVGMGYTYADKACARFIFDTLGEAILGTDFLSPEAAWQKLHDRVRNQGHQGLTAMAIAAVDTAMWDLKAKILDVSVSQLIGKVRPTVPVYGSGGFCSYGKEELGRELTSFAELGISNFKIKVGRNPSEDLARIAYCRKVVGDSGGLFVDANGAFSMQEALAKAHEYANEGVRWFEEPVEVSNVTGLSYLTEHCPSTLEISTGEYGYDVYSFLRWAQQKAMHVAQIDATRCGGISNFLKIYHLLSAYHLPVSTHTAPMLHRSLGLCLPNIRHVEYFIDHVRIEERAFDGFTAPTDGILSEKEDIKGLGLTFRHKDMKAYEQDFFSKRTRPATHYKQS